MDQSSAATTDEWDKGSHPKLPLWVFYAAVNLAAAAWNSVLIVQLAYIARKQPLTLFLIALCLGCATMSGTCGMQCLLNAAVNDNRFAWGWSACWTEAFAHVASILLQFFALLLFTLGQWWIGRRHKTLPWRVAVAATLAALAVAWGGTLVAGWFSTVYLMPAGNYCFFEMNSPAIAFFFLPVMTLTLLTQIVCYIDLFVYARRSVATTAYMLSSEGQVAQQTLLTRQAQSSILYVGVFVAGWGVGPVFALYQLSTGVAPEALDMALGINGSLHSLAVPLVYRWWAKRFVVVAAGSSLPEPPAVTDDVRLSVALPRLAF